MNRKRLLLASAVAVAGVLAVGLLFGLANVVYNQRLAATTIDISTLAAGKCSATTRDERLRAYTWKSVTWNINDPTRCLPEGAEVEIRFAGDDSPLWFLNRPKHRTTIKGIVSPFARKTPPNPPYSYAVWAVGRVTDYKMEDPELEIIQ